MFMFTLNLNLMKYEINQFMHPSICLFICNILLSIDKVDKVWLTVLVRTQKAGSDFTSSFTYVSAQYSF